MAPVDAAREFQRGNLDYQSMDVTEFTASNFMLKDLIEIICIHERSEKCHACKVIQKRNYFTLISALDKLLGQLGIYATGLSSIA